MYKIISSILISASINSCFTPAHSMDNMFVEVKSPTKVHQTVFNAPMESPTIPVSWLPSQTTHLYVNSAPAYQINPTIIAGVLVLGYIAANYVDIPAALQNLPKVADRVKDKHAFDHLKKQQHSKHSPKRSNSKKHRGSPHQYSVKR